MAITKISGVLWANLAKVGGIAKASITDIGGASAGSTPGPSCTTIAFLPGFTPTEACSGRRFINYEVGDNGFIYEEGRCGIELANFPFYYSDGNGTVYEWDGVTSIYDNARPCPRR
jgi:hypothetical protein